MTSVLAILLSAHHSFADESSTTTASAIKNVSDGKQDATDALQTLIDSGRDGIALPKGVFRLTSSLVVDLTETGPLSITGDGTATLRMEGPGPAIRIIGSHEGTADPRTVKENVWKDERAPVIRGVEIVGQHPEAVGIEASGTMQLTIHHVVLRKLLHGIHLVKRNRNTIISDSHIYENDGIGIFYDAVNLHQSNIIGCHISYNKQGGIVSRGGDVRNVHIGTCDIEGNMGGLDSTPSANVDLDSRGGSIGEVAIVGCTIQHAHDSPNSANIRFNGESTVRSFTDETRHGNVTIADNVLSDVQKNIELIDARGVSITGNTIWKGFSHNLLITRCESVTVSGNMFDRNPRYHYGDGKTSKNSISISASTGVTFVGNHITDVASEPAAITFKDSRRVHVTGCTILDCKPIGVLLQNCQQSRLSDCLIVGDELSQPVKVDGGSKISVPEEFLKPSGTP